MRLFGKYVQHLEVTAADFLPDGKQLYIVVADAECNIHILQFDPERTSFALLKANIPTNDFTQTRNHFPASDFSIEAFSTSDTLSLLSILSLALPRPLR